jgi:hypothetical protein
MIGAGVMYKNEGCGGKLGKEAIIFAEINSTRIFSISFRKIFCFRSLTLVGLTYMRQNTRRRKVLWGEK